MNIKKTKKDITQIGLWQVYRHIRKDNNSPFYIGIGKDLKRPYSKKYRNNAWLGVVAKTEYKVEILFEGLTKEQAVEKEIEFIKLYGRKDIKTGCLYNMTSGGEGVFGMVYTKERNDKISKTLTGRSLSAETKLRCTTGQKHRISVTINNIEYPSIRQAAKALGIHKNKVKSMYL